MTNATKKAVRKTKASTKKASSGLVRSKRVAAKVTPNIGGRWLPGTLFVGDVLTVEDDRGQEWHTMPCYFVMAGAREADRIWIDVSWLTEVEDGSPWAEKCDESFEVAEELWSKTESLESDEHGFRKLSMKVMLRGAKPNSSWISECQPEYAWKSEAWGADEGERLAWPKHGTKGLMFEDLG